VAKLKKEFGSVVAGKNGGRRNTESDEDNK
jgi:hypothetical protein